MSERLCSGNVCVQEWNVCVRGWWWWCLHACLYYSLYSCCHFLRHAYFINTFRFVCSSEPIIVYGSNIHAYCCVQSLLTLGIAGSNIALVQPPTEVSLLDHLTAGIDVSPSERQLNPFEWCPSDKYINRPPHCLTERRQHSHV